MSNKKSKNFSVVMPLYFKENHEYFAKSLQSLIDQTLQPSEIIIILDGQIGDDLKKVIDRYKNNEIIKIIKLEKNHGIGYARRVGIENCSTNIFAVMDSDDICNIRRFELQYNKIIEGEFDVIGGYIEEFDEEVGDLSMIRKLPLRNEDIYKYGKWRMPVNNVTLMFTREVYEMVGGYPDLRSGEDWHLVAKWLANKVKFCNLDEVLVYVRGGKDMIKRRRTFNFQFHQLKVFPYMYKLKYIGFFHLFANVLIRLILIIMPTLVTTFLYKKILRKNINE
tara:strand:+ start:736 stop:1572 length:837 start_codon:yes stop_codon:yes gene_type:complete